MKKQNYITPDFTVLGIVNSERICQVSPLDPYTGNNIGDDLTEE